MPIRRTRMIGGERYIKAHHAGKIEIEDIMSELKGELEKNKKRREALKEEIACIKTIRTRKNELLKEATEAYKKIFFQNIYITPNGIIYFRKNYETYIINHI